MESKGLIKIMKLPNYSTASGKRVDGIAYTFILDFLSENMSILNIEQLDAIENYNFSPEVMEYTNPTSKTQYEKIGEMIGEYKFQLQSNKGQSR